MHTSPERVRVDLVDTREEDLALLAARTEAPRVYVRASVEPWDAPAVVVLDAAFASVLVGRMLGGGSAAPADAPRPLSTAECAVIEFLSAQLLAGLNEAAGEPLFRLESVSDKAGALGEGRAVVTAVRARVDSTAGLVRLVYGPEVLAALDELRGPLLRRGRGDVNGDADGEGDDEAGRAKLTRYGKFCAGADLHVLVGETEVDPVNLAELEAGDVVLVEQVFGEWEGGRLGGALRVRVGDGDNVLIAGRASQKKSRAARGGAEARADGGDEEAEAVRVTVEEISFTDAREAEAGERLSMEDERELATEDAGEGAGLLDNLLLTVRVELAARRISLEELTRLRAGQILDLGCRATDPVELIADGRRVATGELVDIEGRLGVRVTRLAG
jgi:flagellar motor switch/type III secretory pathway protein FliN